MISIVIMIKLDLNLNFIKKTYYFILKKILIFNFFFSLEFVTETVLRTMLEFVDSFYFIFSHFNYSYFFL